MMRPRDWIRWYLLACLSDQPGSHRWPCIASKICTQKILGRTAPAGWAPRGFGGVAETDESRLIRPSGAGDDTLRWFGSSFRSGDACCPTPNIQFLSTAQTKPALGVHGLPNDDSSTMLEQLDNIAAPPILSLLAVALAPYPSVETGTPRDGPLPVQKHARRACP
jgi:hypothetical protein